MPRGCGHGRCLEKAMRHFGPVALVHVESQDFNHRHLDRRNWLPVWQQRSGSSGEISHKFPGSVKSANSCIFCRRRKAQPISVVAASTLPRLPVTSENCTKVDKSVLKWGLAGEGNRTLVSSLEGYSFTIKLHPRQGCPNCRACALLPSVFSTASRLANPSCRH